MIGITDIGLYLPAERIDTASLKSRFDVDDAFIQCKTGFSSLARKNADESVVDMCAGAFADLEKSHSADIDNIDVVCVCTQNGDKALPQASAMLQERLGLSESCASFDIALGCSGYVYSLTLVEAFMERNGLTSGLVFTCDPYSPHLEAKDKNTQLLFGDGATVTYLSKAPVFTMHKATFATIGRKADALTKEPCGTIHMDGREIFNFSMRNVPKTLKQCLKANNCSFEDVDLFILHQGSRFMLDSLRKSLSIKPEALPFFAGSYGNTVSSSIPFGLKQYLDGDQDTIALCGFGVGLSIASVIIRRT